jgi:3-(3-hydroxy-phenyl)propionate hydroxylase
VNLTSKLAAVIRGESADADLDRYDLQRRLITIESVQSQTIQNKRDLEATTEEAQREFRDRLRRIADDRDERQRYLERVSMISSLQRAAQLC